MLLVQVTLLAAMAMFSSAQVPPLVDNLNSKFYDTFGDETSLACDGCYVMVRCRALSNPCSETDYYHLIDAHNKTVATASCDPTSKAALLRLDINENTILGPYKCKYGDLVSEDALNLLYRLCSKKNRDFMKGSPCSVNDFCFITGNPEKATCGALGKTMCREMHTATSTTSEFCPGGKTSLCEAFANEPKPTARMTGCSPDPGAVDPNVRYPAGTKQKHLYNAPIQMDKTLPNPTEFLFSFLESEILRKSNLSCTIEDRNGTVIDHQSKVTEGAVSLTFTDAIFNGTQPLKLECLFVKNTTVLAWLSNYLVFQDPGRVNITSSKDEKGRETLKCAPETEPNEGFHDEFTWTDENQQTIGTQQELKVTKPGTVTCNVNRVFIFPGPFRHYRMKEPAKAVIEVKVETTTSTSTKRDKPLTDAGAVVSTPHRKLDNGTEPPYIPPTDPPDWLWPAIVGIGLLIIAVVVTIVLVLRSRSRRHRRLDNSRLTSRRRRDNSRSRRRSDNSVTKMLRHGNAILKKLATGAGAMGHAKLQEWCNYRKARSQDEKLDETMTKLEKKANKDEREKDTKRLSVCRLDKPLLECTKVVVRMLEKSLRSTLVDLHMNRMADYFGNNLLLCMAPIPPQFFPQWAAIFQEKVGVVVWIGRTKEVNKETGKIEEKIDEYSPLKEDEPKTITDVRCGKVTATATKIVSIKSGKMMTTKAVFEKVEPESRPAKTGGSERVVGKMVTDDRELTHVHVEAWNDHAPPDSPQAIAEAIKLVEQEQKKRAKEGDPGVLVHCSMGLGRSPDFLICYIGYQMWKVTGRVDPMGILEYVRNHRILVLSASTMSQLEINMHLGVIAEVLKILCTEETAGVESKAANQPESSGGKSMMPAKSEVGKSSGAEVTSGTKSKTGGCKVKRSGGKSVMGGGASKNAMPPV